MRTSLVSIIAIVAVLNTAGARPVSAQSTRPVSASLGTQDLMPQLGKQKMPLVPELKRAAQLDAEIVVAVDGAIVHTRVLKSTDSTGALERACLDAMRQWRLKPAVSSGGQAMATLVRIRFEWPAPTADGKPGEMQASLQDIVAMPPPPMQSVANIAAHEIREPGLKLPTIARQIQPQYTREAMRAKLQGTVELDVIILADGTVGAARVTKGLGFGLDEAALAAARYWLFEPASLNGQPVPARVTLQLEFRLR
jgi:TonB family protein